ncbi:MAG: type IX secretion system outer membrane channel protein PorV [Cyclobacteriaceae bacterium]|nr:type IX secretion system outer membrane channel protein PorV [Cyclobacteriaceae bacterium SS2]
MNGISKYLSCLCLLITGNAFAQSFINGASGASNPITTAVPFVGFAPDSRGSALGDAGVATSPDVYSTFWNNAKLAFIEKDMGFSFSYSPWLGRIVDDMSLNYLTFYKKIDRIQTFGASMRYFDLGEIYKTDIQGLPIGTENPKEVAIDATYSRKLTDRMSIALSTRFIWSNLTGDLTGATGAKNGTSVAIDLGYYYTQPMKFGGLDSELSFGAHLSNFGQKVTYSTESQEDFIPTNLRLGTSFTTNIDPFNTITLVFDVNKLLVPTPPIYATDENGDLQTDANGDYIIESGKDPNRPLLSGVFGSFSDAPGGFSEEIKEIMLSVGSEYWYRDVFAVRVGYFLESEEKGNRKFFTAGIGFRYQVFGVDFSYLIPKQNNHPLGDTLRLSFLFNLDKNEPTEEIGNGG